MARLASTTICLLGSVSSGNVGVPVLSHPGEQLYNVDGQRLPAMAIQDRLPMTFDFLQRSQLALTSTLEFSLTGQQLLPNHFSDEIRQAATLLPRNLGQSLMLLRFEQNLRAKMPFSHDVTSSVSIHLRLHTVLPTNDP